jgi:signal transduction histidine kinase
MTSKIVILLTFFIITFCSESNKKHSPKVINGILDLRNWDFNEDGIIPIVGEGEFFWGKFINFNDPPDATPTYYDMTKSWGDEQVGTYSISKNGFASYRVKILLKPDAELSIYKSQLRISSKIFWNGKLIDKTGEPGTNLKEEKPSSKITVIPLKNINEQNNLLIQISGFNIHRGGFASPLLLGEREDINKWFRNEFGSDLIIFSSLISLSIFYFVIYLMRKKELALLYFAIFCTSGAMRVLGYGEIRILFSLFSKDGDLNLVRLVGILAIISLISFSLFIYESFKEEVSDKLKIFILHIPFIISFLFFIIHFFSNLYYYILSLNLYIYLIFIFLIIDMIPIFKGSIKNKPGSRFLLFSIAILCFTIILDILFINGFSNLGYKVPYGFIFISFSQAFFLSNKMFTAYKEVEDLSLELEIKIEERTQEYKKEKERAERANELKEKLVSITSHDLKSPLVGVNNFLETLNLNFDSLNKYEVREGILECKKSIKYTLSLVDQLLIHNLLSDENLKINYAYLDLKTLLQDSIERNLLQANQKNISINNTILEDCVILSDFELLSRVFSNIISNSIKFSHSNSSINIYSKKSDLGYSVFIIDNGIGMTKNTIDMLFNQYKRPLNFGTHGELGTGLGLLYSKEVISILNGNLFVESTEEKGSTFEVFLPYREKVSIYVYDKYRSKEKFKCKDDNDFLSLNMKLDNSIYNFIEKVHVNRIILEKKLLKSHPDFNILINNLNIEIITY